MESIRCFIAIKLPDELKKEIKNIQNLIKNKNFFDGMFVEKENLHLTLKFLGEIDSKKIEEVKKRLKEASSKEFDMYSANVGVFNKKEVRIIWLKINNVNELQKEIDERLKDIFDEEKRYMGHVTIARVKKVNDKQGLLDYLEGIKFRKMKFIVKEFYLIKSELSDSGPIYEVIEKYSLER